MDHETFRNWLRMNSKSGRLTQKSMSAAARQNRLDILKYVRHTYHDKWSQNWINENASNAVVNGNTMVLTWLYESGDHWTYGVQSSELAANIGGAKQFDTLYWIHHIIGLSISDVAARKMYKYKLHELALELGDSRDAIVLALNVIGDRGGDIAALKQMYNHYLHIYNMRAREVLDSIVHPAVHEYALIQIISAYANLSTPEEFELVGRFSN